MTAATERLPTEADAARVALDVGGEATQSVQRFATGIGHWVYDVRTTKGSRMVVRMGTPEQVEDFLGARHWSNTLRPLGVPLPRLLAAGEHRSLPYLVLERLDGEDLGQGYGSLSMAQLHAIAEEVCRLQRLVGSLPEGRGYGYVRLPSGPYRESWADVVSASLERSRGRLDQAGLVDPRFTARVARRGAQFQNYFSRVRPTPFLDDATTKNVLVHSGRLSGIVDVDWLCFGDPLFTVALTRTALLSADQNPAYTDHWCELLCLTAEQHRVVHFYTALFCVDFMSEFGQRFNRGLEPIDVGRLARLEQMLVDHLDAAD